MNVVFELTQTACNVSVLSGNDDTPENILQRFIDQIDVNNYMYDLESFSACTTSMFLAYALLYEDSCRERRLRGWNKPRKSNV